MSPDPVGPELPKKSDLDNGTSDMKGRQAQEKRAGPEEIRRNYNGCSCSQKGDNMTYKEMETMMKNGALIKEYWTNPYNYKIQYFKLNAGNPTTIRKDFVLKYMKNNKIEKLADSQKWVTYIISKEYRDNVIANIRYKH